MTHLAYGSSGLGRLLVDVLPEWAELPFLVLIFVGLMALFVYGQRKQRREGTPRPRANVVLQRGASITTLCASVLLEIVGVIGVFAFGSPWGAAVFPLILCAFGVYMVRATRANEQAPR
ncbi:hypothetical protein ACYSUO_23430 [Streptomyces sp. UC4497]